MISPLQSAPADSGAVCARIPIFVRKMLRSLAFFAALALLSLSLLNLPLRLFRPELDSSWAMCLAHFFKSDAQAGVDWVFTYGPLGSLFMGYFDGELFFLTLAWELSFKVLAAWILLKFLGGLPSPVMRGLGFAVLVLCLSGGRWQDLGVVLIVLFCCMLLLVPNCGKQKCVLGGFLVPALGLAKFTLLAFSSMAIGLTVAYALSARRFRLAVALAAVPIAWLIGWCLLGQELQNVPEYLRGASEIARGYAPAMALPGSRMELVLAAALLGMFALLVATYARRATIHAPRSVVLLVLFLAIFVQWKLGFVRHDGHATHFFTFFAFVPFLIMGAYGPDAPGSRLRNGLALGCVVLALYGNAHSCCATWGSWAQQMRGVPNRLVAQANVLLHPWRTHGVLEAESRRRAARCALPEIARHVGNHSVDLFNYEQAVVLMNGWDYRPRPIFQSYSAYTPALTARNASFMAGARAPEFVLMNLTAIDARPPTLEDPAALRTVLGRYAFVTIEKDFILFRKKSGAWPESSSERSKVKQRTISFGEEVELDEPGDGLQTISLKINDTWKGKVRSTLWQPKQLDLCVTSQSGAKQHCRLVPAMAEAGFVINPLLRDNHDLLTYLHRRGSERVRSIRVTAGLHPEAYYQPTIAMTLSEVPFLSFADANLASRTVDVSPVSAIVPCRPEAQGDSGMKLLPLARTQLDHAEFVHGVQVTVELDDASKKLSNLRVSWKTRADPLFAKDQSQTRLLPIAAGQAKVHVWIYDRFDSLLFETDHPAGLLRIQEVRILAQHADRSRAAAAGQVYRAAPAACPDCDSARSR